MTVELLVRLGWAAFSLASPEPAASSAQKSSPSDPLYTSVCPSQAWTLKSGDGGEDIAPQLPLPVFRPIFSTFLPPSAISNFQVFLSAFAQNNNK